MHRAPRRKRGAERKPPGGAQQRRRNGKLVALSDDDIAQLAANGPPHRLVQDCRVVPVPPAPEAAVSPPPTPDERRAYSDAGRLMLGNACDYDACLSPHAPAVRQAFRQQKARMRLQGCAGRGPAAGLLYADAGRVTPGVKGLRLLTLPPGTEVFKGTRYFYDDAAAIDGSELPYMWVGNAATAIEYAQRYQGGCMVYRATRELRLFILDTPNCQRLYDAVPWPADADDDGPLTRAKAAMELKFGVGVPLHEQARRVHEYKGMPGEPLSLFHTRDLSRFTDCRAPTRTLGFGAGSNDRVVADLLHALRDSIAVDGWFSPESFSPYSCSLPEELLLFSDTGVELRREHPLFWRNWFQHLPLPRLPRAPFDLRGAYFGSNRDFRVLRSVLAAEDARSSRRRLSSPASGAGLDVLTLDVRGFISPNALETAEAAAARCARLLLALRPHVVTLQSVPPLLIPAFLEAVRDEYTLTRSVVNEHVLHKGATDGDPVDPADNPDDGEHGAWVPHMLVLVSKRVDGATLRTRRRFAEVRYDDSDTRTSRQDCVEVRVQGPVPCLVVCASLTRGIGVIRRSVKMVSLDEFVRISRANAVERVAHLHALLDRPRGSSSGKTTAAGTGAVTVLLGRLYAWPDSAEAGVLREAGFDVSAFLRNVASTTLSGGVESYALVKSNTPVAAPVACSWKTLQWGLSHSAPLLLRLRLPARQTAAATPPHHHTAAVARRTAVARQTRGGGGQ
jgi:hypothetical protein